ncbi:ketopantoate reductase family protein, partial [Leucobacter sp. M11]|uniref:ketopantoate reductase family protein n=1 Tax=Leucobacter sp. M11 TaxID=2993565 RepID=UPI002D7F47A3
QTRAEPATRDLVNRAMREVFAVARADGAELGDAELTAIWDSYLHGFAPETTSSLQRDLAAGRPSELADQSGAVVRHAERLGLDAPVHRAIAASQAIRE